MGGCERERESVKRESFLSVFLGWTKSSLLLGLTSHKWSKKLRFYEKCSQEERKERKCFGGAQESLY